ncbi:tRNA N(3)-methylcytidine methyltransferase METTL6 [Drosophila subobscura]|uniref:tRNA N(3)-methylcytidine methyltransferase METTL6 n=1 Tax=Drosophila subobscura TaxID=7241 RepID=UPI00155A25DD|nr:tRNA N(3)-methylcytidine methyltransferase METTL6 [Drosophila subobscura]
METGDQLIADVFTTRAKELTAEEKQKLEEQNKRLVPEFKANKLEVDAQRHWDIFYKRNETRFFKDRHWTTREFQELLDQSDSREAEKRRTLLEVGCGVGNLVFPLLEEQSREEGNEECVPCGRFYFYACDFSPRAVDFVRANRLYDPSSITAFQCDITTQQVHEHIPAGSLDVCTMIFVLSAIHPHKFEAVVQNLWRLLKPGGLVLFRDYGLYDMAQLRFKPGNKIADNLYVRQDGTRSYYFAEQEVAQLFTQSGFEVLTNAYVHRRTLNIKEGVDVPRIFLQGKFRKKAV